MPTDRQLDRILGSWLEADAPGQLPDRVLRATFERTRASRQQAGWRAIPGRIQMSRTILAFAALAAVLVVAVAGLGLAVNRPGSGAGGTTAPTATAAPTATPTPTATPRPTATPLVDAAIPDGGSMRPGSYVTRPLPAPHDGLALRFTVPAGWYGFGDGTIFPDGAAGLPLQFIEVTALNSDLCHWAGPKGEVNVGTTVDDLVEALVAQTKYQVSDPVDVSIGGYSGKRVDVVFPAKLFKDKGSPEAPGCDEQRTHLFGDGGIYGQAPNERWQTNILDVDGTRFVIVVQDYPETTAAERAGAAAIVDSMVITP